MKPSPITVVVSIAGMILGALGLYFGSILPYIKAQSYIDAERRMASVRSVDDFRANFDRAFNIPSPVGDEEVAKFMGNSIMRIISQGQPEEAARQLVLYAEEHLFDDDVRHLLLQAQMHKTLWENYSREADYQKAIGYFEMAHAIGPNLPPPLYNLLSLYGLGEDRANFERVGRLILSKWPQDEKVRELFE